MLRRPPSPSSRLSSLALLLLCASFAGGDEQIDFARDVQPILWQHCVRCHGEKLQESNYRLDVRKRALSPADFGTPPIVKHDADASPLWRYISSTDPAGTVMPPEDVVERPSERQLATIKAWIDQGADWPDALAGKAEGLKTDHWSFQPLTDAIPPGTANDWIRNPVDSFTLSKMRQHGLTPSPAASRRKLIRRVYLVMHGLPPSPDEVNQFVTDTSPDAYEQMVDRVLSHPRYGERWGQHWLDVVRFAETHGFETNRERTSAFHYRDYVINSLNADKPYDEFVKEQICGDAVGSDAATGFLVAGPYDLVKSPDINLTLMQRQDELADIVNTTGTTFLGLTLGCARCHNHKFDPILQSDYYSLQAVFAGVNHGERRLRSETTAGLESELARLQTELRPKQESFAQHLERARRIYQAQPRTSGKRPAVNAQLNHESFENISARAIRFRIQATNTGAEPCIDELEVFDANDTNVALASQGAEPRASGTLPGYEIHQLEHINDGQLGNERSWISNSPGSGWIEIRFAQPALIHRINWGRDRNERFRDRVPTQYVIEAETKADTWKVVASSEDREPLTGNLTEEFLLKHLPDEEALAASELSIGIADLEKRIKDLSQQLPTAWIGTFRQPEATHRLYRGDPMAQREIVAPDTLAVMGSLGLSVDESEQNRRVRFANWVVNGGTPLTSRVLVNRLWHYHFGVGIVATPSDLGAAGAKPTHPLLLDWLARELVNNQWSLKHVHRLILLSATFKQDSRPRSDSIAVDASAQFLWRFPPRRLEAEAIRDSILEVAGSLDAKMGGPGFSAFQVELENVRHYFPKEKWGPTEWRRMVYMTKVRQEQDAVFGSFDCPDGNQTVPRRSQSTTPLQALNLLNSSFVLQQSDRLAQRIRREAGGDVQQQIVHSFELLMGRLPDEHELKMSQEFIHTNGLVAFCRAMFNGNEFLFIF